MQAKDLDGSGHDLSESISRYFSGGTEKTTKDPVTIAPISAGFRFPYKVWNVIAIATCSVPKTVCRLTTLWVMEFIPTRVYITEDISLLNLIFHQYIDPKMLFNFNV